MSPEVVRAIPELVGEGVIPAPAAERLSRIARGDLVSVRWELRALLYLGVLLVTSGVGLLLKENFDRIGPIAVALALGVTAAAALGWAVRRAPPFSWGAAESPDLAFDYVLLLGLLLAAADLAFVEWKFTPLGNGWPWHLLVASILFGLAAVRFDSRVVLSLALSTFAAWRGISVALLERGFWSGVPGAVRGNAIVCGAAFVALGIALDRTGRKRHFEPVASHFGWLLLLGALASGIVESGAAAYGSILLVVGGALAFGSFRARRYSLFAIGVLGAYVGLTSLALRGFPSERLGCAWILVTSVGLIGILWFAHRRMREPL